MKIYSQTGITLLLLVIIIIILFILSGIVVNLTLTGGIIGRAKTAAEITNKESAREILAMLVGESRIEALATGGDFHEIFSRKLAEKEGYNYNTTSKIASIDGFEFKLENDLSLSYLGQKITGDLLLDKIKAKSVTTGDGVYYTNDPDKIQKDNNNQLVVSEQYYFRGLNPNNWIEFGQVSKIDTTPLLWRILYLSDEGIKIIYEGTKRADNSIPLENGRIKINDSVITAWNPTTQNYWETPVALKTLLLDWYENKLYISNRERFINPINWPIAVVKNNNPNDLKYFVDNERKDVTADSILYPGVTSYRTAVGLINPSYFILASGNINANESYATQNDTSLLAGERNFLRKPTEENGYVYWTNNAYNGNGGQAWHIGAVGRVSNSFTTNAYGIRPVLNLNKDIIYKSGTGTLSDPYVIKMEQ